MSDQMINIIIEAVFLFGIAGIYYVWQKKRIIQQDKLHILDKVSHLCEILDQSEKQKDNYASLLSDLSMALKEQNLLNIEKSLVENDIHLPQNIDEIREDIIIHIESHKIL